MKIIPFGITTGCNTKREFKKLEVGWYQDKENTGFCRE